MVSSAGVRARPAAGHGRRWVGAIDKLAAAVDSAAADLDVEQRALVVALASRYGAGTDVAADTEPSGAETLTGQLGPYLSGGAVRRRAGITRQALHARRGRFAIIGVPTDNHAEPIIYPVRQFTDAATAAVLPGVQEVAALLASGINDPLTIAVWLDAPHPDLGGKTAYAQLRDGAGVDRVLAVAGRDARRWRR